MDVCAVCEFWVLGKAQNFWVCCHRWCIVYILQGLARTECKLFCLDLV